MVPGDFVGGVRIAESGALLGGLGQEVNYVYNNGLEAQLYAYAIATGLLGVAIHLLTSTMERRALHWHPSQRVGVA